MQGDSTLRRKLAAAERRTVKENPHQFYVIGPAAELTPLVRGALPTDHDHDGEPSNSIREYQSDRLSR